MKKSPTNKVNLNISSKILRTNNDNMNVLSNEKIDTNFTINPHSLKYNKKEHLNKTNSRVLDLLRMEMKNRRLILQPSKQLKQQSLSLL